MDDDEEFTLNFAAPQAPSAQRPEKQAAQRAVAPSQAGRTASSSAAASAPASKHEARTASVKTHSSGVDGVLNFTTEGATAAAAPPSPLPVVISRRQHAPQEAGKRAPRVPVVHSVAPRTTPSLVVSSAARALAPPAVTATPQTPGTGTASTASPTATVAASSSSSAAAAPTAAAAKIERADGDTGSTPAQKSPHRPPPRLAVPPSQPQPPSQLLQLLPWTDDPAMLSAESFSALPLDARLLAKLTAASVSSGGASATAVTSSAVAGISRGHLRDGFGLTRPTRVQRMFLPRALAGHSVLARSETGSGKTLAFLLPIAQGLLRLHDATPGGLTRDGAGGTRAIVLAPTRELCQQIFEVATRLLQPFPFLVPGIVAGGEKRKSEKARLRRGCVLLIASPGRLLDHLRTTEAFDTRALTWLVLDEADRLLDLGFGAQIADIVAVLRQRRTGVAPGDPPWRTFFLSATLSTSVRQLAASVLGDNSPAVLVDASLASAAAVTAPPAAAADAVAAAGATGVSGAADGGDASGPSLVLIDVGGDADGLSEATRAVAAHEPAPRYATPTRLAQQYAVVAIKWRLVTLLAATVDAVQRASKSKQRAAQKVRDTAAATVAGSGELSAAAPGASAAASASAAPSSTSAKLIIFLSTTDSVDFHFQLFSLLLPRMLGLGEGSGSGGAPRAPSPAFAVMRLHGNMSQGERTNTFRRFGGSPAGVLLATDVAARGLDLPSVDVIIQADAPSDTQDYVHRVGRTARKGDSGRALILLQPHEAPAYTELLRAAGMTGLTQVETGPMLATLARSKMDPVAALGGGGGGFGGFGSSGANRDSGDGAGQRSSGNKRPREQRGGRGEADGSSSSSSSSAGGGGGTFAERVAASSAALTRIKGLASAANEAVSTHNSRRSSELLAVLWQAVCEELVASSPAPASAPAGGAARTQQRHTGAGAAAGGGGGATVSAGGSTAGSGPVPTTAAAAAADAPLPPLLDAARTAFVSFVRGYATHEKSVRHIFHPRALHLGHCAKAFGLKEAPSLAVARGKGGSARAAAAAAGGEDAGPGGEVTGAHGAYHSSSANALHWDSSAARGGGGGGAGRRGGPVRPGADGGQQHMQQRSNDAADTDAPPAKRGKREASASRRAIELGMIEAAAEAAVLRPLGERKSESAAAAPSASAAAPAAAAPTAAARSAPAAAAAAAANAATAHALGRGGYNAKPSWKVSSKSSGRGGTGGGVRSGGSGGDDGEGGGVSGGGGKKVLHKAARSAERRAAVSEFAA